MSTGVTDESLQFDRRGERRSSVLTDTDIEKIKNMMVAERIEWAETLGYDVTTPQSRLEIRKDHELVRNLRYAKGKIIGAFLISIGGSLALWLWNAAKILSHKS